MDFTIRTDLIEKAIKTYSQAADGDTIVAVQPFTYGGVRVPSGAAATYRSGNITELPNGERYALDNLASYPVLVVPNSLDYPPGHESQPVGNEPPMTPDVIERAEVERVIREYAEYVGYPEHAQELIDRLPRPESPDEERVLQLRIRWNPDNESDPVGWDWQTLIDGDGLRCAVLEVTAAS